jgi:23S rRNA pseudouridine1911/1915/1917 synthase
MHPDILYEDNHLLVVNKPVNMPVQADVSGDKDLQTVLKEYLAKKYDKPGEVFLGIVHRLDRPVGGVMVFARTSKAASRLSELFRRNEIDKEYHAVVCGTVRQQETLRHWLMKNGQTNMVSSVTKGTSGAKEAVLHYNRVGISDGVSLIRIRLETGRPHQIRVQCAESGFPVWGDQRYNAKIAVTGQQIALWATRIAFIHPVKKTKVEFISAPPSVRPWMSFPGLFGGDADTDI